MIVDLHRDVRHASRLLAVRPGEWPHEVVPVGLRDVQLLDYTLVERDVDLAGSGRRVHAARVAREVGRDGYAFFVELAPVAPDADAEPGERAAPAVRADALLRRAQMLAAAAQACRDEATALGRGWPGDLQGLAAALKLERMTQGLVDRAGDVPLEAPWLRAEPSTG